MTNSTSVKRRLKRIKLFRAQRGKCYWCPRQMSLRTLKRTDRPQPSDCTLDHLDDRFSPERGKHPREKRVVAACWECNHRRGVESQQQVERAELHARSGRAPSTP